MDIVAAIVCVILTLRKLGASSTRGLLLGDSPKGTRILRIGIVRDSGRGGVVNRGAVHAIPQVAGFFGGGVVLLVASVCYLARGCESRNKKMIHGVAGGAIRCSVFVMLLIVQAERCYASH